LQGIDREVENAARLDGAGSVRLTRDIRLPLAVEGCADSFRCRQRPIPANNTR
jgi:ABC-type glycerol-3-phosphate transport system permease component